MSSSEILHTACNTLIPVPPLKDLTPLQSKYLTDEKHRFIICAAGRRSRKTLIAKRKILHRALINNDTLWFHGAPTYQQAKDIFWDDLKNYTRNIRTYKSDSELYVRLRNGSEIHCIGLDKAERIEGRTKSWNGCHLAEFGDMKPGSWAENIRPVLADTLGSAILDGVPDPYKSGYSGHRKLAQHACGGSIPHTEHFDGAYGENGEWAFYTWYSADVLPDSEIQGIKKETDPQTFRIEYEASFETIAGRVYHGFNPDYYPNGNLDKSIKYDKNLPIVMAFDFNVSPMTAILGHVVTGESKKQEYHAFKGYFLKNSNTRQLITRILDEYVDTNTFYLTPCQSSIARQTSQEMTRDGYRTDLAIIKEEMYKARKKLYIKKRSKNPAEHKAIRATNSMLFNNRLLFNPDDIGLREFQNDLEQLTYKEGTSAIDESDKMRNHISKAVSYLCEKYWPVKNESKADVELDIIL